MALVVTVAPAVPAVLVVLVALAVLLASRVTMSRILGPTILLLALAVSKLPWVGPTADPVLITDMGSEQGHLRVAMYRVYERFRYKTRCSSNSTRSNVYESECVFRWLECWSMSVMGSVGRVVWQGFRPSRRLA